jgi:hypothetical protein
MGLRYEETEKNNQGDNDRIVQSYFEHHYSSLLVLFRVRAKINLHFQVLRRLPGKAPKRRNIDIFLSFGNAARQDASAQKHVKLFLREPLALFFTAVAVDQTSLFGPQSQWDGPYPDSIKAICEKTATINESAAQSMKTY